MWNISTVRVAFEQTTQDTHVEIKSRIDMAKAAFNKEALFTSKLDCNSRKKPVNCYIWSIALCGAGTGHCGKCIRNTWEVLKHSAGEDQLDRSCEKLGSYNHKYREGQQHCLIIRHSSSLGFTGTGEVCDRQAAKLRK